MSKLTIINGEKFIVKEEEYNNKQKIFSNLKIFENLGLHERLISLFEQLKKYFFVSLGLSNQTESWECFECTELFFSELLGCL